MALFVLWFEVGSTHIGHSCFFVPSLLIVALLPFFLCSFLFCLWATPTPTLSLSKLGLTKSEAANSPALLLGFCTHQSHHDKHTQTQPCMQSGTKKTTWLVDVQVFGLPLVGEVVSHDRESRRCSSCSFCLGFVLMAPPPPPPPPIKSKAKQSKAKRHSFPKQPSNHPPKVKVKPKQPCLPFPSSFLFSCFPLNFWLFFFLLFSSSLPSYFSTHPSPFAPNQPNQPHQPHQPHLQQQT